MKATVIQAQDRTELEKKLNDFLKSTPEGKPPVIRFMSQSEYSPAEAGMKRVFSDSPPHINVTILWE